MDWLEERRLLAVATVTTLSDTVDFNDGVTSLREAIFATNTVGGADTIEFDPALTAGGPTSISLTQGELWITDALTVNGPGAELLTIDASGNDATPDSTLIDGNDENDGDGSRVFRIDDVNAATFIEVALNGLTLTGGDVADNGGAISSGENLSLARCIVTENVAVLSGGGIFHEDGTVNVALSEISRNTSKTAGGA